MRFFTVIPIVLICSLSIGAQTIYKAYEGLEAYGLYPTESGDFFVAGRTSRFGEFGLSDAYVQKIDRNGNTLWRKAYGSIFRDQSNSICKGYDNSLVIAGMEGRPDSMSNGNSDAFIAKVDTAGLEIWSLVFDRGGAGDRFHAVIATSDTAYVAVGVANVFIGSGVYYGYIQKVSNSGDSIWSVVQETPYSWLESVTETADGGLVCAGTSSGPGLNRPYAVKFNSNGDTEWTKTEGWGFDFGFLSDVKETGEGDLIFTGNARVGSGGQDILLVKSNPTGEVKWTRFIGEESDDRGLKLALDDQGNAFVTGSLTEIESNPFSKTDAFIAKFDTTGSLVWLNSYGEEGDEVGEDIHLCEDGGIVVTGNIKAPGRSYAFLLKTDSLGNAPATITSINDFERVEAKLFPNPVQKGTGLNVELEDITKFKTVGIVNAQGALIREYEVLAQLTGSNSLALPTAGLVPGVYYVVGRSEKGGYVFGRFILK